MGGEAAGGGEEVEEPVEEEEEGGEEEGKSEVKFFILTCVSSHSWRGTEPATTPAPAYTLSVSPRTSAERIATQNSQPSEDRWPSGPA